MLTLALAQMLVEAGRPEANLARAWRQIGEAARRGAQVVLLPEALDLGWTHPSAATHAEPIPEGRSCRALAEAARRHGVYVAAGLVERAGAEVFNSAVLLDPAGTVLLHHRKLNELDIAHGCYGQGDRLGVAHTPLASFGLMICADALAAGQVLTRALGYLGAQVILSPCAWAVPAEHDQAKEPYGGLWRAAYGPVARDFQMWIAGVSNVGAIPAGAWRGWRCIGCSLVVGPDGAAVVQGPYGPAAEALLLVKVEPRPRPARGCGWEKLWREARPAEGERG